VASDSCEVFAGGAIAVCRCRDVQRVLRRLTQGVSVINTKSNSGDNMQINVNTVGSTATIHLNGRFNLIHREFRLTILI
jgi:hypothetical protein